MKLVILIQIAILIANYVLGAHCAVFVSLINATCVAIVGAYVWSHTRNWRVTTALVVSYGAVIAAFLFSSGTAMTIKNVLAGGICCCQVALMNAATDRISVQWLRKLCYFVTGTIPNCVATSVATMIMW